MSNKKKGGFLLILNYNRVYIIHHNKAGCNIIHHKICEGIYNKCWGVQEIIQILSSSKCFRSAFKRVIIFSKTRVKPEESLNIIKSHGYFKF